MKPSYVWNKMWYKVEIYGALLHVLTCLNPKMLFYISFLYWIHIVYLIERGIKEAVIPFAYVKITATADL